jgi:DNA-binding MarR family transcriptional regulator
MNQVQKYIDVDTSLGYLLKQASSALRTSMEVVLRPLGMNVTHYSCLELLSQKPGLSNSELARGTFVTRQSMNTLLLMLDQEGYVKRQDTAPSGRALPTILTAKGRKQLLKASSAIKAVEDQMLSQLDGVKREEFRHLLQTCIKSLNK